MTDKIDIDALKERLQMHYDVAFGDDETPEPDSTHIAIDFETVLQTIAALTEMKAREGDASKFMEIAGAWHDMQDDYAEASIAMHVGDRRAYLNDTAKAISNTAELKFLKRTADVMMGRPTDKKGM